MSTPYELLARANAVYFKYEKYVVKRSGDGDDEDGRRADGAYGVAYAALLDRVNGLMQKADEVRSTTDRAAKAALNADVRRAKAAILDVDLPALQKLLAKRGIIKALSPDQLATRHAQLAAARGLVVGVPDGVHVSAGGASLAGRAGLLGGGGKQGRGTAGSNAISLIASVTAASSSSGASSSGRPRASPTRVDAVGYWAQSEAASAFRAEYEASKKRQDGVLDGIEKGLGELKEIGSAMGRALDEQYVLTAAIDDKVGDVTKNIKQSNTRVKSLLSEMRPARNFCIDATLLCILLAIGLSIYNAVMQQKARSAGG